MVEVRDRGIVAGDEVINHDTEIHGESPHAGERRTIDGTVHSQRGRPDEISHDVFKHGHEPTDVQVRGIAYTVAGLIIFIITSAVFVAGVLFYFESSGSRTTIESPRSTELTFPSPRLQITPGVDRAAIENSAKVQLHGYAWSDVDPQRARIPIERAMELLAEHGWPDPEISEAAPPPPHLKVGDEGAAGVKEKSLPRIPLEQQPPTVPPLEAPP